MPILDPLLSGTPSSAAEHAEMIAMTGAQLKIKHNLANDFTSKAGQKDPPSEQCEEGGQGLEKLHFFADLEFLGKVLNPEDSC